MKTEKKAVISSEGSKNGQIQMVNPEGIKVAGSGVERRKYSRKERV